MNNGAIADNLSLLSKLIDIHGDDSFKAKSYASAAYTIDKLPVQLSTLPEEKIYSIKGIGQATGKKILELINTGGLSQIEEYLQKTPSGILDMMHIKGLGPKKISTIWKDLGLENIGELLYACEENRLLLYKGFGAKTQQNIKEAIELYLASQGSYLFGQIEEYAQAFTIGLKKIFPKKLFLLSGNIARHNEVIEKLEWVTDAEIDALEKYFNEQQHEVQRNEHILTAKGEENVLLEFESHPSADVVTEAFKKNCSPEFLNAWQERFGSMNEKQFASEEQLFTEYKIPFIPAFYREAPLAIEQALDNNLPHFIQTEDIKGIIHTHSDWSDGGYTIEQMAQAAIAKGFEYLVISDHSQSAYYAKGLYPDRIKAQHELIDEVNERFKPFRIFKSIESDILNDGSLDYTDEVLASFDLVITSVHSNLKMSEEKAMGRLLKAIANPYTTILGHATGRLLLSRKGYPIDHEKIIDACAENNVVIEINANPRRLDMDWRYIKQATDKGVLLSINPDAHKTSTFDDIRYGVIAAQKGGLMAKNNLSSYSLKEFEAFLKKQKGKR